MKQEEKELLLQDLCARLPYGVIVETPKGKGHVCDINLTIFCNEVGVNINPTSRDTFDIEEVKPYLFPMSNMTEEECDIVEEILGDKCIFDFMCNGDIILKQGQFSQNKLAKLYDYYNLIHVDYRNLIPKGLAIDCTNLNIY